MKSLNELDSIAAETMGWVEKKYGIGDKAFWSTDGAETGPWADNWNPTTNIDDAYDLVKKAQEDGFNIAVDMSLEAVSVSMRRGETEYAAACNFATNQLPLAITVAFIEAHGKSTA